MMQYPKIHSLWKRHGWYFEEDKKKSTCSELQKTRQSFIVGDYAIPEFATIKKWLVQEKIDGTNIRINLKGKPNRYVVFSGRTDEATIPRHLLNYLHETFLSHKLQNVFPDEEDNGYGCADVWLFGEGYGPKIQKGGGNYRADVGFILFDVKVGNWWLSQESVKEIAAKLNVPYAPIIGIMTEEEIVEYVKSKPLSLCSATPQVMEGIIARPDPLLLLRDGKPLMMKLKCKEFKHDVG